MIEKLRPYGVTEEFISRDMVKRATEPDYITVMINYINKLATKIDELEERLDSVEDSNIET